MRTRLLLLLSVLTMTVMGMAAPSTDPPTPPPTGVLEPGIWEGVIPGPLGSNTGWKVTLRSTDITPGELYGNVSPGFFAGGRFETYNNGVSFHGLAAADRIFAIRPVGCGDVVEVRGSYHKEAEGLVIDIADSRVLGSPVGSLELKGILTQK